MIEVLLTRCLLIILQELFLLEENMIDAMNSIVCNYLIGCILVKEEI